MPCGQKPDLTITRERKEKSWARRVDVNSIFYFGVLIILAGMNVYYTLKDWDWDKNRCEFLSMHNLIVKC